MNADISASNKRFRTCENKVVSQIIDDEAIIINMETGCYYSLDSIGAAIWDAIQHATPTVEIVKMLESRYDCSAVDVADEVGKLLLELEAEQLVEPLAAEYDWKGLPAQGLQQHRDEEPVPFKSPRFEKHSDMRDFLLVDPIHHVDDRGWPHKESS